MTAPASPDISELLSAYEIEGEIGRGSWGVVLKARHRQLGREVAVKQLPVDFSAQEDVRRRFVNEARLLASLDHPHIVPVYDYIEREGVCLLVMEYLPGGTVWQRFNAEGFDYIDSVSIALATCAGLHYAHRHGVLHRDIKPENLVFSSSGILKVTDFGIAKVLGAASTMGTRAGEVLGSPAYIAPEQATGSELGPFTDIYATGVVLYELLSGSLPFPDDGDPLMVMYRHVHEPPRPLKEAAPDVPDPIAEVVTYALATKKEERYQSAEEFGVALAEAATASFGPGWLQRSAIPIMGGGPIIAATERTRISLDNLKPSRPTQPERLPLETGMPALATPPTPPPSPSVEQQPTYSGGVQPEVYPVPYASGKEEGVGRKNTGFARLCGAVALSLIVLATLIAFFGPSKPASSTAILDRQGLSIAIQGTTMAGDSITVDFDRPVDFRIEPFENHKASVPENAKLLAQVSLPGGVTVPVRSQLATKEGDVSVFVFEGRQFKYLVAGKTTLHLTLETPDVSATEQSLVQLQGIPVQLEPANKNLFAIPTIASSLVLLAVFAYGEALIVPLRRKKKRIGSVVGLGVLGAIGGIALGYLGWALGTSDPSTLITGIEVFLCGSAGVAFGLWAYFLPLPQSSPSQDTAKSYTA